MFCPKKDKYYIIPTHTWLKPLEPFITDDINTEGESNKITSLNNIILSICCSNNLIHTIISFSSVSLVVNNKDISFIILSWLLYNINFISFIL